MGRGLGEIQKKIIEILKHERKKYAREWYDIINVAWLVHNGLYCFESLDGHHIPEEPPESVKQSVWRAVRSLEKRGLIKTKIEIASWRQYWNKKGDRYGGSRWHKKVKLIV